jgi:sec-independent protein translocase protein TatC
MTEESPHIPEDHEFDEPRMSVLEHLNELRYRLFYSVLAIIIFSILSFFMSRELIELLKLAAPAGIKFIQISPGEVFIVSLKVALYAGIYFASPVIFYQFIGFVAPGLRNKEKKYLIPSVFVAFFLFTLGILFAYFLAMPLALTFLLSYGADVAVNTISISKYVSFNAAMIFAMGVLFQVPLLLVFLALINVVNSQKLVDWWKYVIVAAFVLGAVLTPSPDPFAQSVVAGATLILYGISIYLIKLIKR